MAKATPSGADRNLIKFTCLRCGATLKVPLSQANRYIECPKCKGRAHVPKDQAEADEESTNYGVNKLAYDVTGECRGCGAKMPKKAIICTKCGYDYRSGKNLEVVDKTKLPSDYPTWNKIFAGLGAETVINATIRVFSSIIISMISIGLVGFGILYIIMWFVANEFDKPPIWPWYITFGITIIATLVMFGMIQEALVEAASRALWTSHLRRIGTSGCTLFLSRCGAGLRSGNLGDMLSRIPCLRPSRGTADRCRERNHQSRSLAGIHMECRNWGARSLCHRLPHRLGTHLLFLRHWKLRRGPIREPRHHFSMDRQVHRGCVSMAGTFHAHDSRGDWHSHGSALLRDRHGDLSPVGLHVVGIFTVFPAQLYVGSFVANGWSDHQTALVIPKPGCQSRDVTGKADFSIVTATAALLRRARIRTRDPIH